MWDFEGLGQLSPRMENEIEKPWTIKCTRMGKNHRKFRDLTPTMENRREHMSQRLNS